MNIKDFRGKIEELLKQVDTIIKDSGDEYTVLKYEDEEYGFIDFVSLVDKDEKVFYFDADYSLMNSTLLIEESPCIKLPKILTEPYSLVKEREEKWQNAIRKEYVKNNQLELRAWHKDLELMEKVEELNLNFGSCRTENYNENIKNFILMRFTGLYDCNGTKIYEGDIVDSGGNNNVCYEVRFIANRGIIAFCDDELDMFIPLDDISQSFKENCQVIGNVYQHSELLK